LNKILLHLVTVLRKPEDIVIQYFSDETDMYILAKGEISINIVDK